MIGGRRIIQNAYYVRDIDAAIVKAFALWGAGPFFVRREITLSQVCYRGRPAELKLAAAYGQCGDIQLEFVTQLNDAPSAFRDMFAPEESGFHHVAVEFGDHGETVAHFKRLGLDVATSFLTAEGRGASYIDARSMIGHMIEVYVVNESLRDLYQVVRSAAAGWDGRNLIREM